MSKRKSNPPKIDVVIRDQHYVATITRDGEIIAEGRGDLPKIAIERAQAKAVDVIMVELAALDDEPEPDHAEPDVSPD